MKKQFFSNEKDGFYGTYYENPKGANCAMIGLFGDDPNDFMAKCGAKWLHKNGVNVMCMSPDVKNYGHVNFTSGKDRDRYKVAQKPWKQEDRHNGNEYGRNGFPCGSFIFP